MMIHEITGKAGKYKPRKRVGRGESSGMGKTSGRGSKGAKSRSGWSLPPQYQGGQINFIQKMPKRGFTNAPFKKVFHIINVKDLDTMAQNGDEITVETLAAAGLVRDAKLPLKVLGEGDLTKKITITAAKFSASAKAKIENAGGQAIETVKVKWVRAKPAKKGASGGADAQAGSPAVKSEEKTPKKSKSEQKQEKKGS
jgi:large subunit ribosomal protein L15